MADDERDDKNLDEPRDGSYDDGITLEATSDEGAAETLEAKAKKLREKLRTIEKERDEYLAGWQRSKADLINWKRDEERAKKDLFEYANGRLIDELLPVVDGFELAFSNKEVWESVSPNWRMGVEHLYAKLMEVLRHHGLEPIGKELDPFDPKLHAAIANVDTDNEADDGKVAEVLQQGFRLKDKVIRPARVKVYVFNNE